MLVRGAYGILLTVHATQGVPTSDAAWGDGVDYTRRASDAHPAGPVSVHAILTGSVFGSVTDPARGPRCGLLPPRASAPTPAVRRQTAASASGRRTVMIRVVLVDDHPDVRWISGYLLDRHPEVVVVGEAATGLEALAVVAQVQPDVVLMDGQMPLLDGIAATQQLRVAYPDVQMVLLSGGDDAAAVCDGLRAGAAGYLLKTTQLDRLVGAFRATRDHDVSSRVRAAGSGHEPGAGTGTSEIRRSSG
ncbi:MAG TPA: response regulator transcription factor [Herpetosiphonaceae bacterium]